MRMQNIVCACVLIVFCTFSLQAQHNYEFNQEGADVTIMPGASVYIWGDARLDGGDFGNSGYVEVQGHFYNDDAASTQSGNGVVEFQNDDVNAGEVQQIRGTADLTGTAAFYDVDLDNRAASPMVELNGVNAGVRNTLEFVTPSHRFRTSTTDGTDGETYANYIHIQNTSNAALVNESTTSGDATNFIEGRLRWDAAAATTYVLPVGFAESLGGNGRSNQVATISTNTGSGTIEASFTQHAGGPISTLNECDTDIDCVINHGWWNIDAISGAFTDFDLTVEAANYTNCPGALDVIITKKADGMGLAGYHLDGSDPCDGAVNTPGSVSRTGFTGMSDFAIAATSDQPLPVDLLSFRAFAVRNDFIQTAWETAAEDGTSHFEVERSSNGVDYQYLGRVEAAGTAHEYHFNDMEAERGIVYYYRIRMVDFDGYYEYSNVDEAMLNGGKLAIVNAYPNPIIGGNTFHFIISSDADKKVVAKVYNALGQIIYTKQLNASEGMNTLEIPTLSWATGTYQVVISDDNNAEVESIIVR